MKYVKMILNIRVAAWTLCLSTVLAFTGCLDESSAPDVQPIAYVALYHGSPDGPGLDVEVDNNQIYSTSFDYAEYTGYEWYRTGERNFKFGPFSSSSVDLEDDFTLEEDKFYSLYIAGEYDDAELIFLNDNTGLPASGKAKIRVINLSPDAGNVDLKIAEAGSNLVSDLEFKDNTDFIEIDAEETDFEIRASDDDELLLSIPNTTVQNQYIYTIIIRGYDTPPDGSTKVLAAQIVRN